MSVFTHNEAKPAHCEPTFIYSSQKEKEEGGKPFFF